MPIFGNVLGEFREFDYGYFENLRRYGSANPPLYPLKKITADVHLLFSNNDWISNPIDVNCLCNQLKNCTKKLISDGDYSHLDYIFGKYAKKDVYNYISTKMNEYLETSS